MATITCPNCKKEIPDNTKFCPECGTTLIANSNDSANQTQSPQKPHNNSEQNSPRRSGAFGIVGFVLSLLAIGFCWSQLVLAIIFSVTGIVFSAIGLGKRRKLYGLAIAGLVLSILMLFLSPVFSCTHACVDTVSAPPKNMTVSVGETFTINDLQISFDEYVDNFTDYEDEFGLHELKEGYKYVKASFTYTNIGSGSNTVYASIYDFDCYADSVSMDQEFGLDNNNFMNDNLSSGHKVSFSVYFSVPTDSKSIELEYVVLNMIGENDIYKLKCK